MGSMMDWTRSTRPNMSIKTPTAGDEAIPRDASLELLTPTSSDFAHENAHELRKRKAEPQPRRSKRQRRPSTKVTSRVTPESSPAFFPINSTVADSPDTSSMHVQSMPSFDEDIVESTAATSATSAVNNAGSLPSFEVKNHQPPQDLVTEDGSELSEVDESLIAECERTGNTDPSAKYWREEPVFTYWPDATRDELVERDPELKAALAMQSYPTYNPFGIPREFAVLPPPRPVKVPVAHAYPRSRTRPANLRKIITKLRPSAPVPSRQPRSAKAKATDTIGGYSWHKPKMTR